MKKTALNSVAIVAFAALFSAEVFGTPQVGTPQPQPVYQAHMMATVGQEKGSCTIRPKGRDDIVGYARYSFYEKEITIKWRYKVQGYADGKFPNDPSIIQRTQTFDVPYHPTDVASTSDGDLLVAGIANPHVVGLFEWTLDKLPQLKLSYSPTGAKVLPVLKAKFGKRPVIRQYFNVDGYIAGIYNNWGDERRPFLIFSDSKKLVSFDLDSFSSVEVAGISSSSPMHVPEFQHLTPLGGFDYIKSGIHSDLGNVYWMYSWNNHDVPIVVFYDQDDDGVIESYSAIQSTADWGASSLSDRSKFIRVR